MPTSIQVKRGLLWSLFVLPILVPAIVVWWWCFVPIQYHFDATTPESAAAFGWTAPGDHITTTAFEYRTRPRLKTATVKLPNLATYTEPSAARMFLHSEGGQPRSFLLQSTPLSQADAADRVRHWSKVWKFDISHMDRWQSEAQRNRPDRFAAGRFSRPRKPGEIDVWLEIRQIASLDDRWYVGFNIYWHPGAEAGAAAR